MDPTRRKLLLLAMAGASASALAHPAIAQTSSHADTDHRVTAALNSLYAKNPLATELGKKAKGILVFPRIVKAGFLVGAAGGNGALRKGGKTVGYYNSAAASYGLQAGVQWFGYALFFMTDSALAYLDNSSGWEIGVGPSVVVVDDAMAKKASSTTLTQEVYAFIFGQKGLMAGMGLEGSKITKTS